MIEKEIFLTMTDAMHYTKEHDVEVIDVQVLPVGRHYKYILTFTKK